MINKLLPFSTRTVRFLGKVLPSRRVEYNADKKERTILTSKFKVKVNFATDSLHVFPSNLPRTSFSFHPVRPQRARRSSWWKRAKIPPRGLGNPRVYVTWCTRQGWQTTDRIKPAGWFCRRAPWPCTGLIVINEQSVSLQAYYPSRSN